jgi:two-component system, LytTR family, response regulator
MKPIHCMVVDDERLARQVLCDLLAAHPDFQIVAEAADIAEAVEGVRRHRPEVLFLDIQMPGGDGFQLLDALAPDPPFVVFVTAYDRHALRAFEVNALDYLLKPVEPARLAVAIQRLRQRMCGPAAVDPAPVAPPELLEEDRVLLPLGNSGCFAPVRDILHVSAQGKYSVVRLGDGREVVVRQTLASWSARLPAGLFASLDRSCLVQWGRIQRATFTAHGAILGFDAPGCELTLGRAAAHRLRGLLAKTRP